MNQSLFHQMARYGVVGLIVLLCDFATYAALTGFSPTTYLEANLVGKAAGAAVGFLLHRHFTFSWEQKHKPGKQLLSYIGLMLFNLAASSALLWFLVDQAGMGKLLAKPFVDIVVIATSFLVSRLWIYKPA